MSFKLSAFEEMVCKQILETGFYKTRTGRLPKAKPKSNFVQAETIRRLFMAIPLVEGQPAKRLRHGFKLQGVWISESLNLAGLNRGFDREAPPAIFENCHFEGDAPGHDDLLMADIVLSGGHFAKLSFKGSRFVDLVADNVIVNGPVDLSGVSSAECFVRKGTGCKRSASEAEFDYPLTPAGGAEEGAKPERRKLPRCAANFAGARIRGDFRASHAKLCVLPKDENFDAAAGKRPYALKLSGARISGSVVLQPEFSAHGGVAIAQAHVDETIWMQGIKCSAEWDTAVLDFGYTKCGGIISIRSCDRLQTNGSPGCDRVCCHGMINFYGAETAGEVHLGGGCHTVPFLETGPAYPSVNFFQAKIGGLIRLTEYEDHVPELGGPLVVQSSTASGLTVNVRMLRAKGGSEAAEQPLWFNNCQIHGDTEIRIAEPGSSNDAPLTGSCASNRVSGDFTFCGADSFQYLDISSLVCGGAVRVAGASLPSRQSRNDLDDMFQPPPAAETPPMLARLSLKNGRVEGMLLVGQCNAQVIELRNCRAGGNVKLQGLRIRDKLDASNMRVEGEFQVRGVVADALQSSAGPAGSPNNTWLVGSCASIRVSGDFTFYCGDSFKSLDISSLVCGGAVRVAGASLPSRQSRNDLDDMFQPPPAAETPPKLARLSLKNGRVEGMLLVGQCNAQVIELRNCRAGGNVKLQGLRIRDKLDASNMRVEGEFQVRGVVADALHHPAGPTGFEAAKAESHRPLPQLNFMGTRVGAALEFSDLDYQWTRDEHDPGAEITAFKSIRTRELSFYPGYEMVEAVTMDGAHTSYLWDEVGKPLHLNGTSPPIHAFNAHLGKRLKLDETTAADYLRFFCHTVWGEDGWFRIPESPSELDRQEAGGPPDEEARARAEAGLSIAMNRKQGANGESVFAASGVTIIYGNAVFVADFRITETGQVEMTDDTPLFEFTGGAPLSFESGTGRRKTWANDETEAHWPMPGPWRDPPVDLQQPFVRYLAGLSSPNSVPPDAAHGTESDQRPEGRPRVNLAFVECSYLKDAGGQAWRRPPRQAGEVGRQLFQLNLDNFSYELHNEDPEALGVSADFDVAAGASTRQYNQWEARRDWLKLQYLDDRPKNSDEFNVQPYEHIAQLFRRSGRAREAAEIIHDRMSIESGFTWKQWRENFSGPRFNKGWVALLLAISFLAGFLSYYILGSDLWALTVVFAAAALVICYPWWSDRLYRYLFYYGLSPLPPMVVFIGLILAGSLVTQYWQRNDVLIYDEMPVELRRDGHGTVAVVAADEASGQKRSIAVKPCGNQINVPLYAVDTFVPLIDLKQEMRCRPNPKYWYWQMAKSVYTALGWIVTSMLILAVSGLIRRRSEG